MNPLNQSWLSLQGACNVGQRTNGQHSDWLWAVAQGIAKGRHRVQSFSGHLEVR